MSIAANMTKNTSPITLVIALKFAFFGFIMQMLIPYYFSYEYLSFDRFQAFEMRPTTLRLICSLLLNVRFQHDINAAFEVLIFLKRMKGHRKHIKGRLINIALISMQLCVLTSMYLSLMINMGQETKMGLIIKNYVALQLLMGVDNMLVKVLPKEV
jgi:hypothetical protein